MVTKVEQPKQSIARVWFRYLQLAIKASLPVKYEMYEAWGTPEELASISFNRWWKERGKALFTPVPATVELIKKTPGALVVSIPLGLKRQQTYLQLGRLLTEAQEVGAIANSLSYAPTGRVNTDALTRYQRMLEIDLDKRRSGQAFKKKLAALQERYEKNLARLEKQKKTMKAKGASTTQAGKFKLPKMSKLKGKERDTGKEYQTPDLRVAHRWLTQGKLVMKNVAEGTFPGAGYYQRKGEASLGKKLRAELFAMDQAC